MIDVSILRRSGKDRVREIAPWGGDEVVSVLYCGTDEMKKIRAVANDLMREGMLGDAAYSVAYGRVCLLGWDGILDNGEPLPFSQENVDLLMLGCTEVNNVVISAASSLQVASEKN